MSPSSAATSLTKKCATAKPLTLGATAGNLDTVAKNKNAEACWAFTMADLKPFAADTTNYPVGATSPFIASSFGEIPSLPHTRVEITNPIDWEQPSGNAISGGGATPKFRQLRVTVFSEMRPALNQPADSIAVGRGRIVIGPF